MKTICLSPLRAGPRVSLAVWCAVVPFAIGGARVNADTYGYEFRPGPNVPAGFKPGAGVDGSRMDLSGSVFVGVDLSNARFDECNLQRARFYQVRFSSGGASFRAADLRNAAFLESPGGPAGGFSKCDFTDALVNGLSFFRQRDHLSLEQLRYTRSYKLKDLSRCQIVAGVHEQEHYSYSTLAIRDVAADFRGFDFSGAVFVAGDFTRCDFRDSIITGATFVRSKITPAQIKSTKRHVIDPETDPTTGSAYANRAQRLVARDGYADIGFSLVDLSDWEFTKADLRGTRFHAVNLKGVSFADADVSGAEFWKSIGRQQLGSTRSYREGNLIETVFVWVDLSGMDFSRKNLTRVRFLYCNISGTDFTDAVITDADFRYLDSPPTVEQIKSTWNYKHGRMAGVLLGEQLQAALQVER